MPRRPTARLLRRLSGGLLLLLVICLGWALRSAVVAKGDLEKARADLIRLREEPPAERADLRRRLAVDERRTAHAKAVLGQLGPALVTRLPILGRSIEAERRVAEAAEAAVAAALDIDNATRDLGSAGRVDLAALARAAVTLQARADRLREPTRRLREAPTSWVPGTVSRNVRSAQDQLGGLDTQLVKAAAAARALGGVLGGDGITRRVLVVLENNAELRGTGGLVSTFAQGTAIGGALSLQPFREVREVADEAGEAKVVPSPADYASHYGPYRANTTLWRNTTMTPDAPTAAAVLAEVAARTTGVRPDVVLLLDVPGIAQIVDATSPIVLEGKRLTGADVIKTLLVDAYVGREGDDAQTDRRRREQLAADAAFDDLTTTPATLSLAKALAEASAGRHLALWSARPAEQADLVLAGAAGAVNPQGADLVMAVTNNLGDSPGTGNKLDYYVDRKLVVDVEVGRERAIVTQTLTLANRAPAGLTPYVEGVKRPGRILELVQMAAGADARLLFFQSGGVPAVAHKWTEDGSRRLAFVTDLGRGQVASWTLRYEIPVVDGTYRLELLPQAVARPAALTVKVSFADGASGVVQGTTGEIASWERSLHVEAHLDRPGLLTRTRERLSRFWNEPVQL